MKVVFYNNHKFYDEKLTHFGNTRTASSSAMLENNKLLWQREKCLGFSLPETEPRVSKMADDSVK